MRTLAKNKQKMYYSLLVGKIEVDALDSNGNKIIDYIDSDGIEYYRQEKIDMYTKPEEYLGNISFSSGEADVQEFGVDVGQYESVMVLDKEQIPITETSLIWFKEEPTYRDTDETIPEPKSATFTVAAIKPSLNQLKVLLKAITK
jgi:hypothetical protein